MRYLPICTDVHDQRCLVVGGGQVAWRKARLLSKAGAKVVVVAPTIHAPFAEFDAELHQREYVTDDLDGVALAVAATDDDTLNARVAADCRARRLAVNVVDSPALCTFVFPSIVDRDPLTIAISSSGAAPVLARMLKAQLESSIPAAYGRLATLAKQFRDAVKATIPAIDKRRYFWEDVLQGPVAEKVFAGDEAGAAALLQHKLDRDNHDDTVGEVYLVGAGPGDPDLLTFKALRLMQKADVVLYDRLVAPAIVDMVRKDAEMVYVGKQQDQHAVPQEQINQLLVRYAKQGKRVLRLKGGDPFIFGRGGEEIEELAENNIPFQVVPGITAASGCACYSGIPLTHRDYAQSVRFVTGHLRAGSADLPWQDLVDPRQTVVFYMGVGALAQICEQLMNHGRSPKTPIALIRKGTTVEQRVVTGTLADMVQAVTGLGFKPPALIIVGEVVSLREKLAWFEGRLANNESSAS